MIEEPLYRSALVFQFVFELLKAKYFYQWAHFYTFGFVYNMFTKFFQQVVHKSTLHELILLVMIFTSL